MKMKTIRSVGKILKKNEKQSMVFSVEHLIHIFSFLSFMDERNHICNYLCVSSTWHHYFFQYNIPFLLGQILWNSKSLSDDILLSICQLWYKNKYVYLDWKYFKKELHSKFPIFQTRMEKSKLQSCFFQKCVKLSQNYPVADEKICYLLEMLMQNFSWNIFVPFLLLRSENISSQTINYLYLTSKSLIRFFTIWQAMTDLHQDAHLEEFQLSLPQFSKYPFAEKNEETICSICFVCFQHSKTILPVEVFQSALLYDHSIVQMASDEYILDSKSNILDLIYELGSKESKFLVFSNLPPSLKEKGA